MARFDRYMLSQLMVLFGFFALVLVSIYWINSAARLFDRLVGDGQSALVFLEFTALTLPNVIRLVLPMSAFAGAVYVTNRLSSESELTVMQATGFSPWRLARPVLIYGIITGMVMMTLTHLLVPISRAMMKEREAEISRNVTAKLLTEGTFLHPTEGVTFYIAEIALDGTLNDVFLSDRSQTGSAVTYTAKSAYLVRAAPPETQGPNTPAREDGKGTGQTTKLVMVDGMVQQLNLAENRLSTTHFSDLSYDISGLISVDTVDTRNVVYQPSHRFITDPAKLAAETGLPLSEVLARLHQRFAEPLLCVVGALIGFSALLVGGFSRFGVWRQIIMALLLLVVVKSIEGAVTTPARRNDALWPLIYLPELIGFAMAGGLLAWSGRKRRRGRPHRPAPDGGTGNGGEGNTYAPDQVGRETGAAPETRDQMTTRGPATEPMT